MLVINKDKLINFATSDVESYLNTLVLKLYQNDITPDPDTDQTDLTISTFTGYSNQNANDWSTPIAQTSTLVFMDTPTHTFVCTGGGSQEIYGYGLYEAGGDLVISERYASAPFSISPGLAFGVALYFEWVPRT